MKVELNTLTPSPQVCVKCKGRLWCGPKCFILERFEKKQSSIGKIKGNSVQGPSPPGVFVSWSGYPKVTLSPMAPLQPINENDSWLSDDTDKWFGLGADKIISFRESLVRGSMPLEVNMAADPSYQLLEVQQALMAKKPVEVQMQLRQSPSSRSLSFSDFHPPMGPQADLKKFSLIENPSTNPKIEKVFSDTDPKALAGMVELYHSGVGVSQLHKLLSAGMLGVKKKRKLTPTRWSITAIDSNVSEYFIDEKIKYFPAIDDVRLFASNYLENYYYVLLLPRKWSYELLEAWKPGAMWNANSNEPTFMADYENYDGRSSYAQNTAGGYYAPRLAIAEYLMRIQRQSTAIVFREIGVSGTPSLGVFKCRETVRDALKKNPLSFNSLDLAMKYLGSKLTIPLKYWFKTSVLFDEFRHQKKLTDFR